MNGKKIAVLCLGIFVFSINYSYSRQEKQVTLAGTVIDNEGHTVGNVSIKLYEQSNDVASDLYDTRLIKETTTDTNGVFSITINSRNNIFVYGYIVVEKEKLALGTISWNMKDDKECEVKLSQVGELSGVVVDENNKPVEQAEVSFYSMRTGDGNNKQYIGHRLATMLYTARTDNAGRFKFTNIPVDAEVDFIVRKAGRATITTCIHGKPPRYSTGQSDIKLVQPIEAKVEGICVEKESGKPIAGQKLVLMQDWNRSLPGQAPSVSKEDGTFTVTGLGVGRCILQLVIPKQGLAEWVAEPVEVVNEAGKTVSGLKMELSRGGVLEIKVKDARDQKPLGDVSVNIRNIQSNMTFNIRSVEDGVARIRLVPGRYRIAGIHKQSYTSILNSQDEITIEAGKTKSLEYELAGQPKITGIVRDDEGKPLKDVKLRIWPFGFEEFTSDDEGKFEFEWDPKLLAFDSDTIFYLIGRHEERNLSVNLEIDKKDMMMDFKLKPGISVTGKVVDSDGKPIKGAKAILLMRALNLGTILKAKRRLTDTEGNFEIRAVPEGIRYSIDLDANGYSHFQKEIEIQLAENGKLDLGTFTLYAANLTVSGVVVDENGKPVANAKVTSSGRNQPKNKTQTDKDGKFEFKVCEGRVTIRVDSIDRPVLSGSVVAEGGDTDVKIIIGEGSPSRQYAAKQPPILIGKSLPDMKDFGINLSPADVNDKAILVCFFDMEQRPSRNCIQQLSKRAQKIRAKDVVVIAVQTTKTEQAQLDEWVKENNISFPVGMIADDSEKIQFTWGVKFLPWLILTNKEHIVVAERFDLSELDDKIIE